MSRLKLTLLAYLVYQRGTYYFGSKIFNNLPSVKKLHHIVKQFRLAPSDFLHLVSFYTRDDYVNDIKD